MQTYLVGGAVRDRMLGLEVTERDWVVVGATPADMRKLGYRPVGKSFPVYLHPKSKEEYALARIEQKTGDGYHGFSFDVSKRVTLEQDLRRRDLTVNAIAEDEHGHIIDPYNGQEDIRRKILRHVSPAFGEDPLRVLRVARFAARFHKLGFVVADETMEMMRHMVDAGELEHLVGDRVWTEIQQALNGPAPKVFFEVLRACSALAVILPEVDMLYGVPQPKKYHPEIDTGIHTMLALEQATRISKNPAVRFATLVHDIGKGLTPKNEWPHHHGHDARGAKLLQKMRQRLPVPKYYLQLATMVCEYHTLCHRALTLKSDTILRLLNHLGARHRKDVLRDFLHACEADARGRTGLSQLPYPNAAYLQACAEALSSVTVHQQQHAGLSNTQVRELYHKENLKAISAVPKPA